MTEVSRFPTALLPEWRSIRRLLVMRLDNLGDVIMLGPALRAIKSALPDVNLTLMASPSGSQVAPLLPWVDETLTWRVLWQDLGRLTLEPEREWQLVNRLRHHSFDAAIIFTSFSQSPHPAGLVCALAGIPLRLGESKEQDVWTLTHTIPAAPDALHQVDRNLRLIESIGFHTADRQLSLSVSESAQVSAQQLLQKEIAATHWNTLLQSSPQPPYILLSPWASCQARTYPLDRFAMAARQLSQHTHWPIVVTGTVAQREKSDQLRLILGDSAIDLMGQTTVSQLVTLVSQAQLVLTNNTSTLHMADATQTPSVVLYSGTDYESQWRPRFAPAQILRQPTDCSPCYAFTCPYKQECLDIQPEAIVTASLSLLPLLTEAT